MISQSDNPELPTLMVTPPAPNYIAFMQDGDVVGKLWLENPLRFEGSADVAAKVFFEHVVKTALAEIIERDERIEELGRDVDEMWKVMQENERLRAVVEAAEKDLRELECLFLNGARSKRAFAKGERIAELGAARCREALAAVDGDDA